MGSKNSTESIKPGEAPPASIMIKKKEELIVVDTLLEEGLNDGDLPHLCLDKTLLSSSGHSALGPKELEDVLASVRRTKRKLNKLSVMFNDTQAQGVGRFLASDRSVREVTILCEKISRESMRNIADALRTNDRVTKLLLGGRELGADDAEALGWMLEASPSLQQLTLFNCGIGDEGAKYLAAGLFVNNTLEYLEIEDDGAEAIARGAHLHPALGHLNLKNNVVGAAGAMALADLLRKSAVLKELTLGGNTIGNAGAGALADAMAANTTLSYLDLEANQISDEGGSYFAQGLLQNVSLRQLNLRRNTIGPEMCERIRAGWNKRNAKQTSFRDQIWHDGLSLPI